jgi:hypothetical protein
MVLVHDMTEPKKIEKALAERITRLIGLSVELEESAVRKNVTAPGSPTRVLQCLGWRPIGTLPARLEPCRPDYGAAS